MSAEVDSAPGLSFRKALDRFERACDARVLGCRPLYTWWQRWCGVGSPTVAQFRLTTSRGELKMLLVRRRHRNPSVVEALSAQADRVAFLGRFGPAPRIVHRERGVLFVCWVTGRQLVSQALDANLAGALGRLCAECTAAPEVLAHDRVVAQAEEWLDALREERLIEHRTLSCARSLLEVDEFEGDTQNRSICFADAASKNFVIADDDQIHYVDVYGIYELPRSYQMLRHALFLSPEYRGAFLEAYYEHSGEALSRNHLPGHYLQYLLRLARGKSAPGSTRTRAKRRRRVADTVAELERYIALWSEGGDPRAHILQRARYR